MKNLKEIIEWNTFYPNACIFVSGMNFGYGNLELYRGNYKDAAILYSISFGWGILGYLGNKWNKEEKV